MRGGVSLSVCHRGNVQIIVGEETNTEMDLTFFSEENMEGEHSTENNGGLCEGESEVMI